MVGAPNENSGDDKEYPIEDKPPEIQPKRRCQRRRSKSRRSKDSNTGMRENNTPDDDEGQDNPIKQNSEQDNWEDGRVSPDKQAAKDDSEDNNYLPPSEDEVSLSDKDFIVPEEPLEQERFKQRLIATSRSLKKKQ